MPIRINLLAETQALEESRRRDPVKRAVWAAVFLVLLMLAWSSSLLLKAMIVKGHLNHIEAQVAARSDQFRTVTNNQAKLADVSRKLSALQQLANNRLLYGTLLNTLQETTIDDVQLVRLRTDQTYALTEATKAKTNRDNSITPGKPATATEKILITLDARDSGLNPGDQVNKFKQAIAGNPYLQTAFGKTNELRLSNVSPMQTAPNSRPYVLFTLECRFPEKTR
jgi:hypothetical protein